MAREKATSEWQLNFTSSTTGAIDRLKEVVSQLGNFRQNLFMAGVGVIYLDRLIYSAVNSFRRLDDVLGMSASAEAARNITYLANSLDIANERLQSFQYALQTVGVDPRDMMDGINQIDQIINEFVSGKSKSRNEAFASWGFNVKDFANSDIIAQLSVIADKVNVLDRRLRNTALSQMFGEDLAKKLGPLLALGSGALLEKILQAYQIGYVLSQKNTENLAQVYVLFRLIADIAIGMQRQLSALFAPSLIFVLKFLARSLLEISYIFQNRVSQQIKEFHDYINNLSPQMLFEIDYELRNINATFEGIGNVMWRVFTAGSMGALITLLVTNPLFLASIALGFGAILAAIIAIDDIWSFMAGEESFIGYLYAKSPLIATYITFISDNFKIMGEMILWVGESIGEIFTSEGFAFFAGDAMVLMQFFIMGLLVISKGVVLLTKQLMDAYAVARRFIEIGTNVAMLMFGETPGNMQGRYRNMSTTDSNVQKSIWSNLLNTLGIVNTPIGPQASGNIAQMPYSSVVWNIQNNVTSGDPTATTNALTNNVINRSTQMKGL